MTEAPPEPTNLVLEQLRVMRAENSARFDAMRAENSARFDKIDARFGALETEIKAIKKEINGLKLNTITEIYKANLTVASFLDREQRLRTLEGKAS